MPLRRHHAPERQIFWFNYRAGCIWIFAAWHRYRSVTVINNVLTAYEHRLAAIKIGKFGKLAISICQREKPNFGKFNSPVICQSAFGVARPHVSIGIIMYRDAFFHSYKSRAFFGCVNQFHVRGSHL